MKIRTARDIGILIKEARTRRGLSQAALAKMITTTQTWVSWIENGKPSAEIGNVLLALTTLGVEMDFQIPPAPTSADHHHNADERHVDDDDDEIPYKL
ncbi:MULTISPECIES: helix-turn-helix domain-containing protein [unclassified Mesorhizobium]|uniref:helix-turn-helix domain-containing protein n=1 Tax=unclassified Mesorhizobium TaxID=325217 RepID=UPI0003CF3CA8|nr:MULTISPECIES: helix-turn-helix domain-containing protein [unclassified Mesorhizobium]ESW84967.1 XRE family transcriptional regulator [Mesorhizobium sp. LSJC269B00]ESY00064.1 XRE family transcriptional regulator [Mesorhizobium sp. LNJC405B00]ESY25828.1 XRE family transcriptional regulator [Mesorhizobium sp. LNJC395A00]ESY31494.1 XRE family transcriptional regulator [Mesorhizobium sp. LNJC391B00]ESY82178.1 XRE family transcriptional regulator [Mesorhizobium sp. LNHC221B00]